MPTGAKYRPATTGDPNLDRVQRDVRDVFDQLEGARRGNLESPTQQTTDAAFQMGEGAAFFYIGDGVGSWTLPRAAMRGLGRSLIMAVVNTTAFALSVVATGSETIDGATSTLVAPGTTALLSCDGSDKWSRVA